MSNLTFNDGYLILIMEVYVCSEACNELVDYSCV